MKDLFREARSRFGPLLDWIQVEVSSYCNGACIYCPRTVYRDSWRNSHLTIELFKRLIPFFPSTCLVYLQGWGEPFMNPNFFKMLHIAKRFKVRVGTTTNGALLNRKLLERIVEEELDIITFSLAGTDRENDNIRRETSIKKVFQAIDTLNQIKARHQCDHPDIHIAYMLLRSGLSKLRALPRVFGSMGISQVVISTLSFIPSIELEKEAIFPSTKEEFSVLKQVLDDLVDKGNEKGLTIYYNLPRHLPGKLCSENITNSFFLGSDGSMSPCVITNIPLTRNVHYFFRGKKIPYKPFFFGNILHEKPKQSYYGTTRSQFIKTLKQGIPYSTCQTCIKRYIPI